jgi:hypothetical protein
MSRAFRAEGGRVTGRLRPHEVELLRSVVQDVTVLLRTETAGPNPIVDRLFPAASPDPETARAVRDLIEDDLRAAKLAAARTLLDSLPDDGRVSLDTETAEQWLTALNDVRLALGTALGVTEDVYDRDTDDDGMHLYHWLSFLQETLVEAVTAEAF